MKNLIALTLLSIIATPVLTWADNPATPKSPPAKTQKAKPPAIKDLMSYATKQLADLGNQLDNIDKDKFYEKWIAWHAGREKTIRIADLNNIKKTGFFIYRAEVLFGEVVNYRSNITKSIKFYSQVQWTANDLYFETKEKKAEYFALLKKEYEKLSDQSLELHKKLATKRESLIADMIKKTNKKEHRQLNKEMQKYLLTVKEQHKQHKLAPTKKVPKKDKK